MSPTTWVLAVAVRAAHRALPVLLLSWPAQLVVVWPEVMPPLGDTVGLINHEEGQLVVLDEPLQQALEGLGSTLFWSDVQHPASDLNQNLKTEAFFFYNFLSKSIPSTLC